MLLPFSSSLFSSSLLLTMIILFLLLSSSGRKTKEITAKMQFMYARMRKFSFLSPSFSLSLHSFLVHTELVYQQQDTCRRLPGRISLRGIRALRTVYARTTFHFSFYHKSVIARRDLQFSWEARARVCIKQSTHSSYVAAFVSRKL